MKITRRHDAFAAIVVMGVSGCGKTTVARMLAERLGWTFIESDDYHSAEQVHKMARGSPLTDADRLPWLKILNGLLVECSQNGQPAVMACSALKEKYRQMLSAGLSHIHFVYLKGSYDLIRERMQHRQHFMKPVMLQSQFEALEEPQNALLIDITQPPENAVAEILEMIQKQLVHPE